MRWLRFLRGRRRHCCVLFRFRKQIEMITIIQRPQIAHIVSQERGCENDRTDDNGGNPKDSSAFLARWRHRHGSDHSYSRGNLPCCNNCMLSSHVHGYSICVYERLIILMFLCQFMMLLKADHDLGQSVFPAFCVSCRKAAARSCAICSRRNMP